MIPCALWALSTCRKGSRATDHSLHGNARDKYGPDKGEEEGLVLLSFCAKTTPAAYNEMQLLLHQGSHCDHLFHSQPLNEVMIAPPRDSNKASLYRICASSKQVHWRRDCICLRQTTSITKGNKSSLDSSVALSKPVGIYHHHVTMPLPCILKHAPCPDLLTSPEHDAVRLNTQHVRRKASGSA